VKAKPDGTILLVRHGPGRGRIQNKFWYALDYIKSKDRALFRQLRFHYTGQPQPDLDGVGCVVFWLADPLREHYPECYAEARAIADDAVARGTPIINAPDALSNTIKSVQQGLWAEADIPTPPHYRFQDREEMEALIEQVPYPAFVRSDEYHVQLDMHLIHDADEARTIPVAEDNAHLFPGTVTPFVDTRKGYEKTAAGTIWAEYYHKKRQFVFGDIVLPVDLFFSSSPIVGRHYSTFEEYDQLRRNGFRARRQAMRRLAPCFDADIEFATGEPEHPELMRRAADALGLEFIAIDYATLSDGSPVLWEANPYFALPAWHKGLLVRERRLKMRYKRIHEAVRSFFADLLPA
jgi:hypothetical protein